MKTYEIWAGEFRTINTHSSDEFTGRLQSPDSTAEQKAEAANALQWLAEQVALVSTHSQLDQAGWRMEFEFELDCVLSGLAKIVILERNGVVTRRIEMIESPRRRTSPQRILDFTSPVHPL